MSAFSLISLINLGFGFPFLGFFITVPTTENPNPMFKYLSLDLQFLSKPAAIPIGLGTVSPNNIVFVDS